ncbi:MAG: hypothetical protein WBB58_01005, partial [Microgenomates group bacterium]
KSSTASSPTRPSGWISWLPAAELKVKTIGYRQRSNRSGPSVSIRKCDSVMLDSARDDNFTVVW